MSDRDPDIPTPSTPEFARVRFVCKHCGTEVPGLEDNNNWMGGWRVTDSGVVVGQEDRKRVGHTTYLGFVPKPEFRHRCTDADTPSVVIASTDSATSTPADYVKRNLVERIVHNADSLEGANDDDWTDML